MKVDLLTTPGTWFFSHAKSMQAMGEELGVSIRLWTDHQEVPEGDVLFILSYYRIVPATVLARHRSNLVIHASDLPRGRGFSPLAWQILEGKSEITFTLFEADEGIDTGPIYAQQVLKLAGNELYTEWHEKAGRLIVEMAVQFIRTFPDVSATPQSGKATHYRRRTNLDDQVDPQRSLAEIFDHLRICDPDKFPAWFEYRGRKYRLRVEAME